MAVVHIEGNVAERAVGRQGIRILCLNDVLVIRVVAKPCRASVGLPGVGTAVTLPGVGFPGVGLPGVGLPGVGFPGVGLPGVGFQLSYV